MNNEHIAKELMDIANVIMAGMKYEDKVKKLMKKYKIDSFSELKDNQKEKFYQELDDSHVSEKEKSESKGNE